MNNLTTFNYNNSTIRTIQKDGETWWVLKDVCDVLDIKNSKDATNRLEEDEVGLTDLTDSLNRTQKTTIINEAGLYNLISSSKKPEARQFKRWINHEVLPTIRKHGAYMTDQKIEEVLMNPDTIIKLAQQLKTEREEKAKLAIKIEEDKPKVVFAEAVSTSDDSILIGQLAKILRGNGLDIGQNRLFKLLRNEGFLMRHSNMPTQKAMDKGLFKIKETAITHSDGHITISRTTKITGSGQVFFINYFLSKRN